MIARTTYRSLMSALALVALTLVGAGVASAHADYKSSIPAANATIASAPATVVVVFTEELAATGNELKVTDAGGTVVDAGDTTRDRSDANRATVVVSLKSGLGNGTYTVAWKNSSTDGHSEAGSFVFTVGAGTTSAPATLPTTSTGSELPGAFVGGAVALVLAGLALRRRMVR